MTRPTVLATVADLVCVLVFATVGRASHGEDLGAPGIWTTAWPFVAGWVLGWVLTLLVPSARARPAGARAGVLVWAPTVVVGMLARLLTGAGVELSFVVVATVVLGVFLLGWRGVAVLVARGRRRAPDDVRV